MKGPVADLAWYASQSAKTKLCPRCPIANAEMCPRYFASQLLLGKHGFTTAISGEDITRLTRKWDHVKPIVREEEPGIARVDGRPQLLSNFCPEITYRTFDLFVSSLSWYTNDKDREYSQKQFVADGLATSDPRWVYSGFTPTHYTECPEYSIFSELSLKRRGKGKSNRAGLGQKLRWQVLERDSYKCQYCGRKPPEVILEIDHKVSVANGGTDDITNLITACLECNRGKGAENLRLQATE